jgi:hypothetical protein
MWIFKKKQVEKVAEPKADLEFGKTWHRIAGGEHTGAYWSEIFIEGVVMQNYDGTGEKPRVVFSVGTEAFIRTEPWVREWYAVTVPLQEPRPEDVDYTEDRSDKFLRDLARRRS